MPTITWHAPELAGQTGLLIWLYADGDATLLNAGGDALTESGHGLFSATVAETHASVHRADLTNAAATLTYRTGWLAVGATVVRDEYPGAAGEQDWTDSERAQIRYRLGLDGTTEEPSSPDTDPITITPSEADFCTAYLTAYDENGVVESGARICVQIVQGPGDNGFSYDSKIRSGLTNGSGFVEFTNLIQGATYYLWRGEATGEGRIRAKAIEVELPFEASYALDEVIGKD